MGCCCDFSVQNVINSLHTTSPVKYLHIIYNNTTYFLSLSINEDRGVIYFGWSDFPTVTSEPHCSLTHRWFKSGVSLIGNIISLASPNMLNHWPCSWHNDALAPSNAFENTSTVPAMNNEAAIRSYGLRPQEADSKDKRDFRNCRWKYGISRRSIATSKRMFTTVPLTSSAFKAKMGNTASLNNMRDLYHVATHQQ